MSLVEDAEEENRSLRRTMRDLVELSTSPADWIGLAPDGIACRLADVLLKKLSVEFIYVQLAAQPGESPVDVLRGKRHIDAAGLEEVRASLVPLSGPDRVESVTTIPDPFGAGILHVLVTRCGAGGEEGVLISGSRNAGFPTEQDRVLLTVGANQLSMASQREQSREVLRQTEARFRSLMEQAPFSVQVFAPDGRTIQVNRAWEELWGTRFDQIGDYNVLEDRQLEAKGVLQFVRKGFAGQAAAIPAIEYNPDDSAPGVDRPADPRRWLSAVIFPLKDPDGRVREVILIHEDITARKRLERELRLRVTQLRDTDRRKDEFLATLAHELRNPLAPIRNSLQILKMPMVDAATASQSRAMMERQVDHLVRLVDDLLDVSRAMRGKIELRKEQVELATVVARAVETAQPLIEVQQHDLDISLPPESLLLDADPVRLSQVFANLLTNAAKYTEPRGHISLSAGREGSEAFVRVNDNGIGIAADVLPHIFDLFVQVDHATTRSQGGLGIGLTLVRNLVEMHSGRVEAHSSGLGKGSEFLVCLPLLLRQEPGPTENRESERRQAATSGHRLLVVDDNKDAATALATLLRLQGHQVRVVHDGISALETMAAFRPALVFLDIGMPGMDGYEVARRIRQTPGMESVLLAALTGWGQEEDRRRTAEAGFDHHLVKPLQNDALEALLADLKRADGQ